MLAVEEITTGDQCRAIKAAWNKLFAENEKCSVFLSYEWFECCHRSYNAGKDLLILLVKDRNEMIGLAPLWEYQSSIRAVSVRKVGFITVPDTPFVDFVIKRGREKEVLNAVLQHLYIRRRKNWDVLTFDRWPVESLNYKVLRDLLLEKGKRYFVVSTSVSPYIPIQEKWEVFWESCSMRFRKTRRNIINRINKLGKVEIECIAQDGTGAAYRDIVSVSERSWKQKEGIAISSRGEVKDFFQALTDLGGQKGWLLVWLLKVNGIPIAMEYDLTWGGRVYALRADFDEAYNEYSPGTYLEYQIVKALFEEGYLEYNTGPGLNAYKLRWTKHVRENITLYACNDNLKGRIIWSQEKVLPILRWLKNLKIYLGMQK